jgi:L-iditol 2-dehydrogenase
MKAAVCTQKERIEIQDISRPVPKEGEVLVQVKATGLCGSDVDGYTGDHPMIFWPITLGHEASGIIAETGPGVNQWQEGDEVVIEPFFTCKKCTACREGLYNLCTDLKITGHQVPGTLAEFVLAEAGFLHPKPKNISFEEAAIAEPVSGSLHAVERCRLALADFAVIIGCGTIGSLAMQHCLNKGAEVMVIEPSPGKRKIAAEFGTHHTLDPAEGDPKKRILELTDGRGADCVIEAVGAPETLGLTTTLVRRGGTIMLIGWSGNSSDHFDLTSVTLDELNVLGTLGFCNDYPAALKLMSMGKVRVGPIISHHLPLEDAERGIQMLKNREEGVWKIVITYD